MQCTTQVMENGNDWRDHSRLGAAFGGPWPTPAAQRRSSSAVAMPAVMPIPASRATSESRQRRSINRCQEINAWGRYRRTYGSTAMYESQKMAPSNNALAKVDSKACEKAAAVKWPEVTPTTMPQPPATTNARNAP